MIALIIVDVQNDFCPGGALAVPEGDQIIPLINRVQPGYDLIVATQDWHPANHGSFAVNHPGHIVGEEIDLDGLMQILWPVHCVQGTLGAAFHPALDLSRVDNIIRKGTDANIDSYSGFFDNGRRASTRLADILRTASVEEVHVCGLATDYCVKFTALDAVDLGFRVTFLEDASRGVNLRPGDVERAIEEMRSRGVEVRTSSRGA